MCTESIINNKANDSLGGKVLKRPTHSLIALNNDRWKRPSSPPPLMDDLSDPAIRLRSFLQEMRQESSWIIWFASQISPFIGRPSTDGRGPHRPNDDGRGPCRPNDDGRGPCRPPSGLLMDDLNYHTIGLSLPQEMLQEPSWIIAPTTTE